MTNAIIENNASTAKLTIRVTYTYSGRVSNHKTVAAAVKAIKNYVGENAVIEDRT